jgi:hypothetical protein
MMLSLSCVSVESVGLPSIEMLVDHGEVQCCGLSQRLIWWGWLNPLSDVVSHA